MKKTTALLQGGACLSTILLAATGTQAAGYQIVERSATGLGRAYSGEAAIIDNASAIGSNPASATHFTTHSVSVAAHAIMPSVDVTGTLEGVLPANSADVADFALVPAVYIAGPLPVGQGISYGIGVYAPFGLRTDYKSSFPGTFLADESDLATINFNPNLAYQVNDQLSIGAGVDVLYVDATLTSTSMGARVLDLQGHGVAVGFNVGVRYEIAPTTAVGLSYRSGFDTDVEGDAISDAVAAFNGPASVTIDLPEVIELSAVHEVRPGLSVHGDITWTGWSSFEEIAPVLDDGTPIPPTPENWDDAFRFSVGATMQYNEDITLRCGVALDETPTSDENRTLRIPDEDRIWLSVGATVQMGPNMSADFGYTHIFTDEAALVEESTNGTFSGSADGHVNIVGFQLNYAF